MAGREWAETVHGYAERQGLQYQPVGGINPKDGPVALCVGGTNRVTGRLAAAPGAAPAAGAGHAPAPPAPGGAAPGADEFWGA
ncbi:MAG TPA: hypothetical protein VFD37_02070, partial [Solirubrobacterales bacterium]|nr:hypothetical protein [Solirubrobacterales bacterium]